MRWCFNGEPWYIIMSHVLSLLLVTHCSDTSPQGLACCPKSTSRSSEAHICRQQSWWGCAGEWVTPVFLYPSTSPRAPFFKNPDLFRSRFTEIVRSVLIYVQPTFRAPVKCECLTFCSACFLRSWCFYWCLLKRKWGKVPPSPVGKPVLFTILSAFSVWNSAEWIGPTFVSFFVLGQWFPFRKITSILKISS